MKSSLSQCKEWIIQQLKCEGASRIGIAGAEAVNQTDVNRFRDWISNGWHGEMQYLDRYHDERNDPRRLLDGARSIISVVFNYYTPREESPLQWATYALGDDYHEVVRAKLTRVAKEISETTGAACRVCVDTAPIRERYWAARSGIGFIGRNNQLIIPGAGSYFFLGEILTTLELEVDPPLLNVGCGNCRRCIEACPGKALHEDGCMDSRRCLSYLTIEHRGKFPADVPIERHIYGCDECQRACPYNRHASATTLPEFTPRTEILQLTVDDIREMSQERFSTLFRHSAIKRRKLSGLQRNLSFCVGDPEKS